ncbi:Solute carrier organic anion transporter family member 1B2 [Mizuhopecten yessoensis]|uniref:Solute carrier organic anion transporter family member 1B2 n=1 Tax=Mizuhopecten yessoensis TaxID=6573 RepID=A0A210QEX5_MIZYE|nr:Solute carrier organic anion transporter family member 1B2 [Mizuhopecten yessoensis]
MNKSGACADEISTESDRIGAPTGYTTIAFSIMAIGLILQGMGKGPRVSLSATYIDDKCVKTKTAMYLGIISCMGIFGPVIAFSLGSVFSRIYITLEDVPIKPNDQRWVGAWWLGFIIFGSMSILVAVPILCFPRRLKSRTVWKPKESKINMNRTLKDFAREIYQLIRNPVYMLNVVCGVLDLFAISASISFLPKYMETQFSLPAWQANMMIGLLIMVSAGLGSLIGGCVVSKFKFLLLTCLNCLMVIKVLFTVITFTDYFICCSNPPIVNYNIPMEAHRTCVTQYYCDVTDYFPICGSDGRNYFSPCQAGCTGRENMRYMINPARSDSRCNSFTLTAHVPDMT